MGSGRCSFVSLKVQESFRNFEEAERRLLRDAALFQLAVWAADYKGSYRDYRGYAGAILGLYQGYIGIMQKKWKLLQGMFSV